MNKPSAPEKSEFSWKARARSFKYAFRGFFTLVKEEHNARIHCVAALLAVAFGFLLKISGLEWCVIMLCIGAVFAAEGFNSSIEAVCDLVSTQYRPLIKKAKDIAAFSVFILALISLICGAIIFLPKIYILFYA